MAVWDMSSKFGRSADAGAHLNPKGEESVTEVFLDSPCHCPLCNRKSTSCEPKRDRTTSTQQTNRPTLRVMMALDLSESDRADFEADPHMTVC